MSQPDVDSASSQHAEDVHVVLVTAPDPAVANQVARTLVEERLAACVNIVPGIRSIYRWQGAVAEDDEILLLVKTRRDRLSALAERVRDLHPYELPETLALQADGGSAAYLAWVRAEASP